MLNLGNSNKPKKAAAASAPATDAKAAPAEAAPATPAAALSQMTNIEADT